MTSSVAPHVVNSRKATKVRVRADGAIEISKALLEEAGIDNACVNIVNHPHSITIVFDLIANDDPYNTYERFAQKGFRISRSTLAKSGLHNRKTLTLAAFEGKVVISK